MWVNVRLHKGFTLIELLVVMAILALLISVAAPRYFHSINKAEEATLKEDLHQMRGALDKYFTDNGSYPDVLDDLVSRKYLRKIPVDPITQSDSTWVVVPPASTAKGAIFDVKSGANGNGLDGTPYSEW